jgi:hypothetical protein
MFKMLVAVTVTLTLSAGLSQADEYTLVIKSAVIKDTKSNGLDWDAIGPPDPYVVAYKMEDTKTYKEKGQTKVKQDTFRPAWDETVLTVEVGDDIVLRVWDKDVAKDDAIGEYKFVVTKKMIEDGEIRIDFDDVKELRFVLKRK